MRLAREATPLGHLPISIMNMSASGQFMLKLPGARQIRKSIKREVPSHGSCNTGVVRKGLFLQWDENADILYEPDSTVTDNTHFVITSRKCEYGERLIKMKRDAAMHG